MAEEEAEETPAQNKWTKLLLSGGAAGMLSKTFVAPLERLRILKQTGALHNESLVEMIILITKNEDLVGFWRGNIINCMRIFPARAVLFSTNDIFNRAWGNDIEKNGFKTFVSGGVSGICAILASYPMDVARTRIVGRLYEPGDIKSQWTKENASMTYILRTMLREEGLKSWFRGIGPTLLGALPYEGIKFTMFQHLTRVNTKPDKEVDPKSSLLFGAIAGSTAGLVLFPNDTVRKLLQMRLAADGGKAYSSALDCWQRTYESGGIGRFYRGLFPYMLRIAPSSAIQFFVYENLKIKISGA